MKIRHHRIKTFIMSTWERYCLLIDKESGIPLYYPNLFVTSQIRNHSKSLAAMEAALTGVNVLLAFCDEYGIDLETRFLKRKFFLLHELDAIRDYCQRSFASERVVSSGGPIPISRKRKPEPQQTVGTGSEYTRLTHISNYSKWLAETLLFNGLDTQTTRDIAKMKERLASRRPPRKGRNQLNHENGLTDEQVDILLEVVRPGSEFNPFHDPAIQIRNRLVILILVYLGVRGGELLNIRAADINWSTKQIVIARRADEKEDTRIDQPLVKTLDHRAPMKDTLVEKIHEYISKYRKKVKNANKNDYLFVTHKAGRTQGQAMSIRGYQKIISTIASAHPELAKLHGHALRHAWNYRFSRHMDEMDNPPTPELQEKIRSNLQGWNEGSGTAASYNQRFTEAKAMEIGLKLQEGITRIPENLKNDR
jgi:integrase